MTLADFNLASRASKGCVHPIHGPNLPGTDGWVLFATPATRREHGDLVGLASVLAWLLRIQPFGDPGACYDSAVASVQAQLKAAAAAVPSCGALGGSTKRAELLQRVLHLLGLQPIAQVWPLKKSACLLQAGLEEQKRGDKREAEAQEVKE